MDQSRNHSDRGQPYSPLSATSADTSSSPSTFGAQPSSGTAADSMGVGSMLVTLPLEDDGSAYSPYMKETVVAGSGSFAFEFKVNSNTAGNHVYGNDTYQQHGLLQEWGTGNHDPHEMINAASIHPKCGYQPPLPLMGENHDLGHDSGMGLRQRLRISTSNENGDPDVSHAASIFPDRLTAHYWDESSTYFYYPQTYTTGERPVLDTPYATSAVSPLYRPSLIRDSSSLDHSSTHDNMASASPNSPDHMQASTVSSFSGSGQRGSVISTSAAGLRCGQNINSRQHQRQHQHQQHQPHYPEERETALERNRIAANRFRMRRKDELIKLAAQEREMEEQCAELSACAAELRDEVLHLKGQLLAHTDCDCTLIQQYIANMARDHVEAEEGRRRRGSSSQEERFGPDSGADGSDPSGIYGAEL